MKRSFDCAIHILSFLDKSVQKVPYPKNLLDSREIIRIEFNYPLSATHTFEFHKKGGFTNMDFVRAVCKKYKEIYAEEDKSMSGKERYIPGMFNRQTSDGKYGIWGHVLGDLFLEGAKLKSNGVWTLSMGS